MELNSLIFPAPSSSYGTSDLKELIWIPRTFKNEEHNIIKKFKAMTVKAHILDENEAKLLSTDREITITKSFDNIKVQASIFKKMSSSEEDFSGEKTPISFVKDFETTKVKVSLVENKEKAGNGLQQTRSKDLSEKIPCHWIKYRGCKKFLMYFHGNAEDIGISTEFVEILSKNLKINIIAVEYPGYGIYYGKPSSEQIIIDCELVFDYLTLRLGIKSKNIIAFGRSIGSGPAAHLAAHRKVGSLILMSPYTSIKEAAKNIAGSFAQFFVAERFRNIEKMNKIGCPICFLHGKKDTLIPYKHSLDLIEELEKYRKGKNNVVFSYFGENMTHNDFHFLNDIINPLKEFFKKTKIEEKSGDKDEIEIENLPAEVFSVPKTIVTKKHNVINFYL